jgi:hypothetical protein
MELIFMYNVHTLCTWIVEGIDILNTCNFYIGKESLKSNYQHLHQYQQNKQLPLTSNHSTQQDHDI